MSAEQDYLQAKQALSEAEVAVANANQKLSAMGLSASSVAGLNRIELRAPFDRHCHREAPESRRSREGR